MSMRRCGWYGIALIVVAGWCTLAAPRVGAVGSIFSYQGQLQQNGTPVDGPCDLQFSLFNAATLGTQIGSTQSFDGISIEQGVFTVPLDFGANAFDGGDRWLQIASHCPAGAGSFTTLTPRQPLTAAPYALFSNTIADGAVSGAKIGAGAVGTGQLADGAVTGAKVADGSIAAEDVNFGYAGSPTKGGPAIDVVFNYAASATKGGPANGLLCSGCVDTSDVAAQAITIDQLSPADSSAGQVLTSLGNSVGWQTPTGLQLPFSASTDFNDDAFAVTNNGNGPAAHFVKPGSLNVTSPALIAEAGGFGAIAITGASTVPSGGGIRGTSVGNFFAGVEGITDADTGGTGVKGTAHSTNGTGVRGQADFGSSSKAVHGTSDEGYAGYFEGRMQVVGAAAGDLIIFQAPAATNRIRFDGTGKGFFNGGTQMGGADVAEFVLATDAPGPGDVVEIDPDRPGHFRRAATPNSTAVAGVISTDPGVSLNARDGAAAAVEGPQLALVGRVPVKTTTENGAIRPGDLLVASSRPGHAMRSPANPAPGTVIGKALSALSDGTGVTEMLVMLR
jgi:hypothetical protein